jgi:protein gp37
MSAASPIEWTDATWNPTVGCSLVSPGCTNCYAMKLAWRFGGKPGSKFHGTARRPKHDAPPVWTGVVRLDPVALAAPLHWTAPRRIFVNSMSDLFHEDLPAAAIDRVFAVMALCPQHTFQVLTKRPQRMRNYIADPATVRRIYEIASDRAIDDSLSVVLVALPEHERHAPPGPRIYLGRWPLPNVWLGTSVEDQTRADARIPLLLETPAAVRFLSCEPLLGPLDFGSMCNGAFFYDPLRGHRWHDAPEGEFGASGPYTRIDWVIAGGESGPGARPMHPAWARSLRDQCAAAGVPFFFKQWGEWAPYTVTPGGDLGGEVRAGRVEIVHPTAQSPVEVSETTGGRSTMPGSRYMARIGKARAGRVLDGRTHDAFPAPAPATAAIA